MYFSMFPEGLLWVAMEKKVINLLKNIHCKFQLNFIAIKIELPQETILMVRLSTIKAYYQYDFSL